AAGWVARRANSAAPAFHAAAKLPCLKRFRCGRFTGTQGPSPVAFRSSIMTRLALTSPVIALVALSLGTGCGAKGSDDDDNTGGTAGMAPASCTGGTSSGATGGTGGSGGSGGSGMTVTKAWTFDEGMDADMWKFEYFSAGTQPNGDPAATID